MIYIKELNQYIKEFNDDTSLFQLLKKDELSQNNLNSDLKKIYEWAYQ